MHRCIALGPETTLQDVCHLLQSFEVFGGESSLFERLRLPGGVCGFSCWDWSIGRLHRGFKTRGEYMIYRKHPPKKADGPGHTRIRGRLLRLFTPYEAIFAIWNMDAGIGRSSAQRICIGLEPS